jgi:hypothetical protein
MFRELRLVQEMRTGRAALGRPGLGSTGRRKLRSRLEKPPA